jgi:hypothetical protein
MSRYFSTESSRANYKIQQFLQQIGIYFQLAYSCRPLNRIIYIPFLKENNLRYKKWNNNYKGIFTAEMENALTIMENEKAWKEFRKWCKVNKDKINEQYKNNLSVKKQNKLCII